MDLYTTRFGKVEIEADDILLFPSGLPGMEDLSHWVLLADAENEALGWLQSVGHPEKAFAVVSPRRFLTDYQVRIFRSEIEPLQLTTTHNAQVLVIVSKIDNTLTLNLKAPLLFNLDRCLGRQVIVNDDQPLQYAITCQSTQTRKSA